MLWLNAKKRSLLLLLYLFLNCCDILGFPIPKQKTQSQRGIVNKNVSQRQSSKARAARLSDLQWMNYQEKSSTARSKVWEFMGQLFLKSAKNEEGEGMCSMTLMSTSNASHGQSSQLPASSSVSTIYEEGSLFCKFCFEEQLAKEKENGSGLLVHVYKTSIKTATGNWLQHATIYHGNKFKRNVSSRITEWFEAATDQIKASSQFEFNRDLKLMACLDLQPFAIVEQKGMKLFCSRNTSFEVPSAGTLARGALLDVYDSIKQKIVKILSECYAGCLLMDGWTDKYRANPYFAVRISVVHQWKFKVLTLKVQPVESHTSYSLSRFVKETLSEFLPKERKFLLFNTTNGAANMLSLSKLLGHERTTCIAHSLHLLITVDSIHKEAELNGLLQRYKRIVTVLHFKGHMIMEEVMIANDKELMDKIEKLQQELMADEDYPVIAPEDDAGSSSPAASAESAVTEHKHETLKASVPTRWNSCLEMIESVLDLFDPLNAVLKKVGKHDLCLDKDEDKPLLKELKTFMAPFRDITLLVSEENPNLSAVPLIRTRIKKACELNVKDSDVMKRVKKNVLANLDKRIPVGDIVNVCVALDPGVRDASLTSAQIKLILKKTYNNVRKCAALDYVFSESVLEQVETKVGESSEDSKSMAKRMRLSMIKETSENESSFQRNAIDDEITK